jgi:hypothetical protein
MNSLLNKFSSVKIENSSRISETDQAFCEKQEKMYREALAALQKTLEMFTEIYNSYTDYDKKNYITYIDDHNDIWHIKDRIVKIKDSFISRIVNHFKQAYKVTLETGELYRKYKDIDVTYQNIVDEVFEQLGGFNFEEKAIQEIKNNCRDSIYNDDKITIKKGKLIINDYIYWGHTWDNKKRLGYSDSKIMPLFKALSHFETESIETLFYYDQMYNALYEGEGKFDIFSNYEIGYNIVNTIKFFKNGKIEIEFQTQQQAEEFKKEYLTK